ncbi:uncharacterized [Tachysurus ichikawai]
MTTRSQHMLAEYAAAKKTLCVSMSKVCMPLALCIMTECNVKAAVMASFKTNLLIRRVHKPVSPYVEADTVAEIVAHFSCTDLLWLKDEGRRQSSGRQGEHDGILEPGEHDSTKGGAIIYHHTLSSCTTPPWAFLPSCLAS